jgi:hypothetical protein
LPFLRIDGHAYHFDHDRASVLVHAGHRRADAFNAAPLQKPRDGQANYNAKCQVYQVQKQHVVAG